MPTSDVRAHPYGPYLVVAAVLVIYAPNLGGEWLNWDDTELLADPVLQQDAWAAIQTAFTTSLDRAWYPLTRLLYGAMSGLGLLTPAGLHLVDLALFAAATAGLVPLLTRLGLPLRWATPAVMLWALHPHRVESVAWAASTKDVLSLALAVAAGLAMWPDPSRANATARPVLGHVAWGAALLAKSAIFPVAGVWWVVAALRDGAASATRRFGGFVALALADGLIARWAFDDGTVPPWPDAIPAWALPAYSYGVWSSGIVLPTRLAAIYPFPSNPWPWVALGALSIGGVLFAAWRRGTPEAWSLASLWLLHPLPVIGLVPLAFWAADRYTLVISLAPAILAAALLDRLDRWHLRAPTAATVALGVLLAIGSATRAADWRSSLALWTTDVGRPGQHFSRHQNLGWAHGALGNYQDAAHQLRVAEALAPDRLDVRAQRILTELFERNAAEPAATAALMPPPTDPEAWAWATQQLIEAGQPDLAEQALATTAQLGAPEWVVAGLRKRVQQARERSAP